METPFSINKSENYAIVKTEIEKLDTHNAPVLKAHIVLLASEGFRNIIFDLSNTRFCDSSGLSAILITHRLCKENKGTFVVACLQESVKKLIRISQLENILNITPTLNEAIDFIFMEEVERDLGEDLPE
ncbi:MAG: STAS domain-containing protein [Flavobacteriales bacterium]|nr:STAS domain-containing protein [Flavobacteriales bacterium]